MLQKLLMAGDVVDIRAIDRTLTKENTEKKTYRSRVGDVLSEDQLEIMMPIEQSKLVLLPVDGVYNLCFYTQKGLYQCNAKVVDRYKNDGVYILLFETISDLKKQQRREYYRYACVMPMSSRPLMKDEVEALEKGEEYIETSIPLRKGTIVDISGGGIRFVSQEIYEKDSMILINFVLTMDSGVKGYQVVGRALRTNPVANKQGVFECCVEFAKIKKEVREEIIQFIFKEERKNRKKEKG